MQVKGKGNSMFSVVTSFLLKRVKGSNTWQRMQIRKNTAMNKELAKAKDTEYQ